MRNILLAIALVISSSELARADGLTAVADFGLNPGALDMFTYVPESLSRGRPLVVVLHGCTQAAMAMQAAGWNTLADEHDFAVLYPEQRRANQGLGCFTWYDTADITRDRGEARSIVAMVDHMIERDGIDPARVYVTGLSAGGAFTTVLLATYPDRFAAGSVMAGLPYRCAETLGAASGCQQGTTTKSPHAWGDLVRAASAWTGPWPRVQVFQGTKDYTVTPANARAITEQWTDVHGIAADADAMDSIGPATIERFVADGRIVVETYLIEGMGHAIVTGDDASGPCPATTGAYFDNRGVCSTTRAAAFFGVTGPGDGDGSGSGSGSGSGESPDLDAASCNAGGNASLGALLAALALCLRRRRQ